MVIRVTARARERERAKYICIIHIGIICFCIDGTDDILIFHIRHYTIQMDGLYSYTAEKKNKKHSIESKCHNIFHANELSMQQQDMYQVDFFFSCRNRFCPAWTDTFSLFFSYSFLIWWICCDVVTVRIYIFPNIHFVSVVTGTALTTGARCSLGASVHRTLSVCARLRLWIHIHSREVCIR